MCRTVLLAGVLGCASTPVPRPALLAEPADLVRLAREPESRLLDAETRANISIEIDGVRQQARGVLLYRAPDSLRMEVLAPVGGSILSALFVRDAAVVYLPQTNQLIEGRAAAVFRRITGMELGYYDIPRSLMGLPDLTPEDLEGLVTFAANERSYRLTLAYGLGERRIRVDRRTLHTSDDVILDRFGNLVSRRTARGRQRVGPITFPKEVRIAQAGNHITLQRTQTKVNTGLDSSRLRLVVPPSAKAVGPPTLGRRAR